MDQNNIESRSFHELMCDMIITNIEKEIARMDNLPATYTERDKKPHKESLEAWKKHRIFEDDEESFSKLWL